MTTKVLPHNHGQSMEQEYDKLVENHDFQTVADIFKLLSDKSRLQIFWLLCHCEECVTNISALVDMSAPAVSHHLRLLKHSKLVVSRREGKEVYYKAADTEQIKHLHHSIDRLVEINCPLNDL